MSKPGRSGAAGVPWRRSVEIQPQDGIMKRMNTLRIVAPLVLLSGVTLPALAQTYQYQYPAVRPVQWFVNGGANITQGETASDFSNGWTFGGGLIVRPDPAQPLALRFDLNYSRSDATSEFINLNAAATGTPIDDGSLQTVTGFADLMLETPINPWARVYALGGVGLGYRRIELTQGGFFCDAFFCGPGFGRELIASSDVTRFAWNAGAGIDFALPGGQSWFIEARYERIETSEAPTEFVPLRIGFRF
jgi:opacity protein-like surface antigen